MFMYVPLGVKSDFSLLQSLVKIPDLMEYLKNKNITQVGLLDDNLFGSMCFYDNCQKNNIKPIIGLKVKVSEYYLYLYAQNYSGYQSLLKINTLLQEKDLSYLDLKLYKEGIIGVLPFASVEIYEEISKVYDEVFLGYGSEYEKKNVLLTSEKIVYLNEVMAYDFKDVRYLNILNKINGVDEVPLNNYADAYLEKEVSDEDAETTIEFAKLIDLVVPKDKRYIPRYDKNIDNSYEYLVSLCKKGLSKRCQGNVNDEYNKRLAYELDVINKMGFVDYFLIVYDYVKFAKTHDILVGPGRGSAAGSLVSYAIGITNVDPIKYNLLFERFLNPDRITMPDIDIDFEYTKRDQVISYVKERYGEKKVANIMTFGTLGARQVIRDVGKCLDVDSGLIDKLSDLLNPKENLKDNLKNQFVRKLIEENKDLKKVYQISFKLEGLKRHISTHAAGVVISSLELDDVIPIYNNGNDLLTGVTMEYLEELGLLKMDFLALKNLTIIQNVLNLIEDKTGDKVNLATIPLDDEKTLNIFKSVDTEGVFQFESAGMKNFMAKLQPDSFEDLIASVALFRPGPMQNIDMFIRRKEGKEKIVYLDSSLEDILQDTYGIIVYQEQIMQILVRMANYSFAESDNIRRAMSKKKVDVMEKERLVFVKKAVDNGYSEDKANEVYDLIIKFANYGFNKAHSVSYALIGYQMAYLKANYPGFFIANLLNMSIGSDIKTKEYIDEAKKKNILIFKPNINVSTDEYLIKDNALLLPLKAIHNVGTASVTEIINERKEHGRFIDFFDFVARTYGKSVNKKTIEALIDGDCFRDFELNHQTLFKNLDSALDYAMLCVDLDESLVMKPNMVIHPEYKDGELMSKELGSFGFYVTNHPSSKYQDKIMKLKDIKKYFDKYVDCVVIIGNVRKIKTKNGENMAFVLGSDETGNGDFIIFPRNNNLLVDLKKDDFVKIRGQVTKRIDKYQVVVSNIEKM